MNRIIASLLFLVIVISSCSKQSNLQKVFLCETKSFSNTQTIEDIKNKFSLEIPKHWKTQLYFDNIQTQLFTADTTKNLTNTYTINVEYNSGDLIINEEFKTKIITDLSNNQYRLLKQKNDVFKEKPSYWVVSSGKKLKYDYYLFELFVKNNDDNYFKITSEIYGDKNVNKRFCESLALIETLKILD